MTKPERIAKFIASCGLCSRRDAEKWILEGRVKVDGKLLDSPATLVSSENIVEVDGKVIKAQEATRLWLYYKPPGLITTHKDPQNRPTVFESIEGLPRVISVGRLDLNSEGLLLLTNDGEFARKMESPSSKIERIYKVRAYCPSAAKNNLSLKNKQITIKGVTYTPKLIEPFDNISGKNRWYKVVLEEGKNREIRKIFEHFGLEVNRLIRISYGKYELGKLKPGEYIEVILAK